MKLRYLVLILFIGGVVVGAKSWKLWNAGVFLKWINVESSKDLDDDVVVSVSGMHVTLDDIEFEYRLLTQDLTNKEELSLIPEVNPTLELKTLKEKILDAIIERKILVHALKKDDEFEWKNSSRTKTCHAKWKTYVSDSNNPIARSLKLKSRLCEQALIHQYSEERLFTNVRVSEDEMVRYFAKNKSRFMNPALVHVRQIVLANEKKARQVRMKVTRRNFSTLAKTHSIGPEGENGGKIKPFRKGVLPRVFDTAFSMKTGQISGILKSTYGFHIFTLDKFEAAYQVPFEDAKSSIARTLLTRKREELFKRWVDLAIHSVQVKIVRNL